MQNEFTNEQPMSISSVGTATIRSEIEVTGLDGAAITGVEVHLDIDHSWTNDLQIRLIAPDQTIVDLVDRRGGFRDDFRNTIFRADAKMHIAEGRAPFRGVFRPEGDLQELNEKPANGVWTLEINDLASEDGGSLNRWSLGINTDVSEPTPFQIDIRFLGGLSSTHQEAFALAADRWSKIITADLPSAIVDGVTIDDVLIEARGATIDGPGGTLGQAGPTRLRPGSLLPVTGLMTFDTADLDRMHEKDTLTDVILHEMAHVLGFGTLWSRLGLIENAGSNNPTFTGVNAMLEYADLTNRNDPTPVPVANTGGPGTADGHWREMVFGDELLTGYISGSSRPLSRVSVAAFDDMGYEVDYTAADNYELPSMLRLAEIGILGMVGHREENCDIMPIEPTILPPEAMVTQGN